MRINLKFYLNEYNKKGKEKYVDDFYTEFEFIAVQELVGDVERFMSETIKMYMENLEIISAGADKVGFRDLIGTRLVMVADVLGVQIEKEDTLTDDFHHRQKLKEINLESLQNDLKYAISIMQSGNAETTVQALNIVRHESQSWIYWMLNKFFDQPIPEGYKPDTPVESKPVEK